MNTDWTKFPLLPHKFPYRTSKADAILRSILFGNPALLSEYFRLILPIPETRIRCAPIPQGFEEELVRIVSAKAATASCSALKIVATCQTGGLSSGNSSVYHGSECPIRRGENGGVRRTYQTDAAKGYSVTRHSNSGGRGSPSHLWTPTSGDRYIC
jgi:hypothetical protein